MNRSRNPFTAYAPNSLPENQSARAQPGFGGLRLVARRQSEDTTGLCRSVLRRPAVVRSQGDMRLPQTIRWPVAGSRTRCSEIKRAYTGLAEAADDLSSSGWRRFVRRGHDSARPSAPRRTFIRIAMTAWSSRSGWNSSSLLVVSEVH